MERIYRFKKFLGTTALSVITAHALAQAPAQPALVAAPAAAAQVLPPSVMIRLPTAPCEFYLVPKKDTVKGTPVTSSLHIDDLEKWLATNPQIDPKTQALYAVGASMDADRREALIAHVKTALAAHGMDDVDVKTIRRLSNFIEEQSGLFSMDENGNSKKLANLDRTEIFSAITAADPQELPMLVLVGIPAFSSEKKNYENLVAAALEAREELVLDQGPAFNRVNPDLKFETSPLTYIKEFIRRPTAGLKHLTESLRWMLPMAEDWQKPNAGELKAMGEKLLIPGLITFAVTLGTHQPLQVLVPVTLINASNSALSGTFRTWIGNWFTRSRSIPEQLIKNFVFSAPFTTDLYWAGVGSVEKLKTIVTGAAWMNFFQTKWLSNLFQASWRMPTSMAIYSWERDRAAKGLDSAELRQRGGVIEKYISYLMTQFYIYSIISKAPALATLYSAPGHLVNFAMGVHKLGVSETLLMDLNWGHVAMFVVGTAAASGLAATKFLKTFGWMDHVSKATWRMNAWESKFHDLYKKPIGAVYRYVKNRFFRRDPLEGVEDDPDKKSSVPAGR